MKYKRAAGFTLVELLVVIAIIGVMVAMLIPAIQASREVGRRAQCQLNLGQIMLAVQSYENAYEVLPAGVINPDGPIKSEAIGLHEGWLIQMLPYLDYDTAYRQIDFSASVYAPANSAVRALSPAVFICPSEPTDVLGRSNYAGCHHDVEAPIAADNQGVLFLNSQIRRHDVSDGASHTIFVGEKLNDPADLGWMSGTRATLRNTGTPLNQFVDPSAPPPPPPPTWVGGFGSAHVGGAHIGFGDGTVRFVAEDIDGTLWKRLGNRADGQLIQINPDAN